VGDWFAKELRIMGVIFVDARNLLAMRKGKLGGRAVTLGRLNAYFHPSDIKKLRGLVAPDEAALRWLSSYVWGAYSDGFFTDVLKFDSVDSIDFSDYEAASLIHDLGEPLPTELLGQFDLAVDGGTLEHIFNFPVAIGNIMTLVGDGGYVYLNTPCNNLCGHGFYQFSPELMYRLFSRANGFEVEFVRVATARHLSIELTANHPVFDVQDPDTVRQRVHLLTSQPTTMMVLAKRVVARPLFAQKVLQSDYVMKWDGADRPSGRSSSVKAVIRRIFPRRWIDTVLAARATQTAKLQRGANFRRLR
jgi:hypothetical protein